MIGHPNGLGTQSAPPAATGEHAIQSNSIVQPLGLTYPEVADLLRVSQRTVRDWVRFHDLPCVRIGRAVRFRPEAVGRWLADREGGAA